MKIELCNKKICMFSSMEGDNSLKFTDNEKVLFLKAFTSLLINANGKGPKNIHIKYFTNEIHIVMNGVVSEFEKYLIKNFGQEAIDVLTDFYERDSKRTEKEFISILNNRYNFKFYELNSDFINDLFIYKMKINHIECNSMFLWKDEFSVKIHLINDQHKRLFEIGKTVCNSFKKTNGQDSFFYIIDQVGALIEYAKYHFDQEEKLMMQYQHLDIVSHIEEHRDFINNLDDLNNHIINAEQETTLTELFESIMLCKFKHIINTDLKFSYYM